MESQLEPQLVHTVFRSRRQRTAHALRMRVIIIIRPVKLRPRQMRPMAPICGTETPRRPRGELIQE
jgi:hypothetical protein